MMTIAGQDFLTDFQIKQLIQELKAKANLDITDIHSQQVYVFESYLNENERQKASQLLNGTTEPTLYAKSLTDRQVVVSPRFGTISPWSSKASDIFHNAGLVAPRMERAVVFSLMGNLPLKLPKIAENILHDRMTQSLVYHLSELKALFRNDKPAPLRIIDLMGQGKQALIEANQQYGFALSDKDMNYLIKHYNILARNPTDAELMMFAQANSEHCRHKIFNSEWTIDGHKQDKTLFQLIKTTFEHS